MSHGVRLEEVPAELLKQELERLAPLVQNKKRSRLKSEFAVLIYEAQRTEAFIDWGDRNLSAFVVHECGLGRPVFEKYKQAGHALFVENERLYRDFIAAVTEGRPRPPLPLVSKLKAVGSVRKRLGPANSKVSTDMLLDPRATRAGSMRIIQHYAERDSYGTADRSGRETLGKFDEFVSHLRRTQELLELIDAGGGGGIPGEKLLERCVRIKSGCESLYNLADRLEQRVMKDG
jgi:hypothetical protein